MVLSEEDDIIESFVAETEQLLDESDASLLALQKHSPCRCGDVSQEIKALFRAFHNIKGTAGFLGFTYTVDVGHAGESLLDHLRNQDAKVIISEDTIALLFKTIDLLRYLTKIPDNSLVDLDTQALCQVIIDQLKLSMQATKKASPKKEVAAAPPPQQQSLQVSFQKPLEIIEKAEEIFNLLYQDDDKTTLLVEGIAIIDQFIESCKATKLTEMEDFAYLMASYLGGCKSKTIDISEALLGVFLSMLDLIKTNLADFAKNNDTTFANYENIYFFFKEEYFAATGKDLSEPEEHHAADTVAQKAAEPASDEEILEMIEAVEIIERPRLSEKKEIRVDVSKLDNLINLVGELVIAQSILLYHPVLAKVDDNELERAIHHLQQISGDLQDVAMTTRMVPLNKTFTKMTRLVYDVAKKANKKVNFEAYGGETEVDRNIIEMIGDPLVHMIRNSIDHGLEHPEERLAVGKKETGLVALEARNESGEVCITVRDDGRGINRKNILKKAIQNGLVKSTDVLTDKEILGLIFEPGFSTAEKVTDISGRGVGMDVVKQNIDKLKGTIEVASIEGSGSVVTLRIPLTLAIIDGMLIRVANTSYMIPLLSVRESLKVENHTLTTTPNGEETILIRNNHIPIVRLYSLFNKKPDSTNLKDGILVICDTAGQLIALYVDEIIGQQQTVIKSLPGYLKNMSGVSGCAIIGNGEISLILDIKGLVSMKNKE